MLQMAILNTCFSKVSEGSVIVLVHNDALFVLF